MREILFRGKSVNTGEWVEGFLVVDTIVCEDAESVKHYHIEEMTLGSYPNEFQSWISETVDPFTVGQFTGLKDKNGKKIFEGDIIHAHYANAPKADFVEQVVFCDGRFCSQFSTTDRSGKMWSALPFSAPHIKNDKSIYMEWCEVIGNIHDNLETLEKTQNGNPEN